MPLRHLDRAAVLLAEILAGDAPADRVIERYFRAHREMGMTDRHEVAESVYGCLRHRRRFEHICATSDAAALVACYWLEQGLSARALADAGFDGDAQSLAQRVRGTDLDQLPFAVRYSLPDWLAERLAARFGEEASALAQALNTPAAFDLRVNTLKLDRDTVRRELAKEGIETDPMRYSPYGLRRRERAPIGNTRAFREGQIEVQDEGSQLVAMLLEPKRREMIVDFCAGAGGKTLALGMLLGNTGTLYAFDVSEKRMARLKPRLKRSGLQNVRSVVINHERDDRVLRLAGKIDRVLVDAPCSGTGTLRRNPDIKWRPIKLEELMERQRRILAAAGDMVKTGGRLVYSTCSLLDEENDGVVSDFLAARPHFALLPAGEALARRGVPLQNPEPVLRLYPHRHGTDGFYAAVLERRG